MATATTASINRALKKAGIDAEFCHARGEGYSYFFGPDVKYAKGTAVYVCYVSDLTVEQWVQYAADFKEESRKFIESYMEDKEEERKFKMTKV